MTAARAVPATQMRSSANDKFKSSFNALLWVSIMVATAIHFGALTLWPAMSARDVSFTVAELTTIELPPEIEIPAPPAEIVRPATPIAATIEVSEDITIAPTTFEQNPVSELPPPPTRVESTVEAGPEGGPVFTPFTVAPEILNRNEIARALSNNYPPMLRSAGIGGTVRVFFFIDENGTVQDYRIGQSSGHAQLDQAALEVAGLYRFSPALNRDKRVPVWVMFPIEFRVR